MSRIGKLPIEIPKGVKVTYNCPDDQGGGAEGELYPAMSWQALPLELSDTRLVVTRDNE